MSATVRIDPGAHATLRRIAKAKDVSLQEALHLAVDAYSRQLFLEGVASDYAALRENASRWNAELAERDAWDAALLDGLTEGKNERAPRRRLARRSRSR